MSIAYANDLRVINRLRKRNHTQSVLKAVAAFIGLQPVKDRQQEGLALSMSQRLLISMIEDIPSCRLTRDSPSMAANKHQVRLKSWLVVHPMVQCCDNLNIWLKTMEILGHELTDYVHGLGWSPIWPCTRLHISRARLKSEDVISFQTDCKFNCRAGFGPSTLRFCHVQRCQRLPQDVQEGSFLGILACSCKYNDPCVVHGICQSSCRLHQSAG